MRCFSWRAGMIAGAGVLAVFSTPAFASSADEGLAASAAMLGAGEYTWGEAAPTPTPGNIEIVVSIPLQQMFVYRGGKLIAASAVSTGREGHETPVGEFTILQKDVNHHSNRYDDAPMPYMERITWDGVAIHGGMDPGYPASHGCVRVPLAFAKKLYGITRLGAHVSIVDDATAPGLPDDYVRVTPIGRPVVNTDPETDATRDANIAAQRGPAQVASLDR
jgi:hypothetical protein